MVKSNVCNTCAVNEQKMTDAFEFWKGGQACSIYIQILFGAREPSGKLEKEKTMWRMVKLIFLYEIKTEHMKMFGNG